MKKVLIITYYWPPSAGAGVQRWLKFVKYLANTPYQIHVLTVDPLKASYPVKDQLLLKEVPENVNVHTTNSFELFALYKKLTNSKEIPFAGFANEKKAGLMQKASRFARGNFFLPDARKGWNKYAYRKAMEIIKTEKINVIVTSSPPHSTQLIGLKLKRETQLPWIADLRDPWTGIYYYDKMLHTAPAKRKDARLERSVLQAADIITVVSPAIQREFQEKGRILGTQIKVIPNGYDKTDLDLKSEVSETEIIISYIGTIADSYPTQSLFETLLTLREERQDLPIRLRFIGKVADSIRNQIEMLGLINIVDFEGYVEHEQALRFLKTSTCLLLIIPKVKGSEGILTGKLFEYIGSGKPILALGPVSGDANTILEECDGEKMIEWEDKKTIKNRLISWGDQWKIQKNLDRNYSAVENYTRDILADKMAKLIDELIENNPT